MFSYKSKYVDFLGTEREETVHFNLTQTELLKMELEVPGGYAAYGQRIIDAKNIQELMVLFEKLIKKSYGVVSPDGSRFDKSEPAYNDFVSSPMYDEIFMKLVTDADFAQMFFNEIIPKNLDEQIKNSEEYKKAMANIQSLPGTTN